MTELKSKGVYALDEWLELKNNKNTNVMSGGVRQTPLWTFQGFIESLGFAGYMSSPVAISDEGVAMQAEAKTFNSFQELQNTDFSNSYLYDIHEIGYKEYTLPEGKIPSDYDFIELQKFDSTMKIAYRVRMATPVLEIQE